jgi:hypothetical protein
MKPRAVGLVLCFGAAFYVAAVVASGLGWNPLGMTWSFENSGAFGDSFGPLGALMASIAAISAFMAYRSQHDELRRVKLAEAQESEARDRRDFESTFFNLLQLLRETVKEIDVSDRYNINPVSGRDALKRILEEYIGGSRGSNDADKDVYLQYYSQFRDDLAHYFRLFYHILKFIENSEKIDSKLYIRLLRATLSDAEIVLIALNCIHGGGQQKLKPLVEKFEILHNISAGNAKVWRIVPEFSLAAFGDRSVDAQGVLSP